MFPDSGQGKSWRENTEPDTGLQQEDELGF